MSTTDTVDLAPIGRAHNSEEESVPLFGIGGEVVAKEECPFGSAAPHQHATDTGRF
jgi:hypothetical protein